MKLIRSEGKFFLQDDEHILLLDNRILRNIQVKEERYLEQVPFGMTAIYDTYSTQKVNKRFLVNLELLVDDIESRDFPFIKNTPVKKETKDFWD